MRRRIATNQRSRWAVAEGLEKRVLLSDAPVLQSFCFFHCREDFYSAHAALTSLAMSASRAAIRAVITCRPLLLTR